jgi:4-amino-4-deoxy-L-arabinose transferase-like glycosyltransferase
MGIFMLLLLKRLRPTKSYVAWVPMLLIGTSGVFAYYARVANLDVPYLFWWVLSFVFLWHFVFSGEPRRKYLMLSAAAAALAIGTKDQSAGLILGFGLIVLFIPPLGANDVGLGRLKNAVIFSLTLIAVYGLLAVATNPWRWVHHVRFVTSDHVLPEYEQSLRGQLLFFQRFLVRLAHVLSPPGIVLGVAGLVVLTRLRKYREALVLVIPAVTYYVAIIGRLRSSEERYLIPIAIILAVSAGVAVGAALQIRGGRARQLRALTLLILAIALAQQLVWGFIPVTYTQLFDTRRELARDIGKILPPGTPLLIANMPSFNVPNRYVYDNYPLMHLPGEKLFPPSTHGENIFHPFDPNYRFILSGSLTTQTAWPNAQSKLPDDDVEFVRQWTYPPWIKKHVHVPSVYEFYLFQRKEGALAAQRREQPDPRGEP